MYSVANYISIYIYNYSQTLQRALVMSTAQCNVVTSDVADTKFYVRSSKVFFICDTALHCTAKLLPKTYTAPRCTANHIFK